MTACARIFWFAHRRAPRLFARVCVRQLALATARGFGVELPRSVSGDADEMLRAYAQFTAAESTRAFAANAGELPIETGLRLRQEMLALATRVRRWLKPQTSHEAWRIVAALYDSIQIVLEVDEASADDGVRGSGNGTIGGNDNSVGDSNTNGVSSNTSACSVNSNDTDSGGHSASSNTSTCSGCNVTMPRCFFAQYYDHHACSLMAYMDEGLMAGIVGQGTLTFTQRITQGSPACRAVFGGEETR